MDWLTPQLRKKVREVFEPRYKRKLTEAEVEEIADNLSEVVEIILKFKWRQKYSNDDTESQKEAGKKSRKVHR